MDTLDPSSSAGGPVDDESEPTRDGQETLLMAQRTSARERVSSLEGQLRSLAEEQALTTHDDEHDPEGMTIGYQRAQFQSLLDGARADLTAIEHARRRLGAGAYGKCARCGGSIGAQRLSALPATLTCIGCAKGIRGGRSRY